MIFRFLAILVHLLNLITVLYMIFKEKRSTNSIIAWTLVLYLLPYVGFIAFLVVGRKINMSKIYIMKDYEIKFMKSAMNQIKQRNTARFDLETHKSFDMIRAVESIEYSPYRSNNEVKLFSDGKEMFEELIESLEKAEKSINIEFYIFKPDELGTRILKILEEKARAGIEVRLLYDSVGSRLLTHKQLKSLIQEGGKIGEFFPAWLKLININMNYRNHRKIVVIDNKVGFVGGFNVGDEYLGRDPKFGYWRDSHIKFIGDAVQDLNLRFLVDWRYATKEDIELDCLVEGNNEKIQKDKGDKGMQIISSGPSDNNLDEIKLAYLKIIQRAKKYIYIQSPYLIIDNSMADSLKLAAASGVDVRIMLPGKGDHPFVYWANLGYAGDLLNAGIKIYHYDKAAFLHAKTIVSDDEVCSIGTANMDTRSFELNFEVIGLIYSEEIAKQQRCVFEEDRLKSIELTKETYLSRSAWIKFKEGLSKLFSAVL